MLHNLLIIKYKMNMNLSKIIIDNQLIFKLGIILKKIHRY